ncbi:MAG: lipopolysaccharide biosynthesis protein RfbH [Lachnospiraceae bacterium]|nr:lipopolysaccharide biosynthesis protein RfbH [Lachnospiraceae bacterium]
MFENMTEEAAREEILKAVRAYTDKYHSQGTPYREGDRIPYAGRYYDAEEVTNLVDASLEFWLTSGRYTDRFEKEFAGFLGVKYVSVVNSGSSANLLAFAALTSPLLKERRILPGDEVITVAAGFPTTVSPIIRYGAVPVFADVTIPQYNIDVSVLEEALSEKTKAVMLAHTLGNPFDIAAVKAFCEAHSLWLVEDNCDALGSEYTLDGKKGYTGTFGDIGTSSFYPPHHMTMGEGGAVYTNNALLHKIVRSMRDWGRDCSCPSGKDNTCGKRYEGSYGTLPAGYDHKYVYSHFGYNLKATDLQAAVGCAQLKKLPLFTKKRRENFKILKEGFKELGDLVALPEAAEHSDPSWFGFLLTLRDDLSRREVVERIEGNGVQTRLLFGGNLLRQPCFDEFKVTDRYRVAGELKETDRIMRSSFWVGLGPVMDEARLDRMLRVIREAVKSSAGEA